MSKLDDAKPANEIDPPLKGKPAPATIAKAKPKPKAKAKTAKVAAPRAKSAKPSNGVAPIVVAKSAAVSAEKTKKLAKPKQAKPKKLKMVRDSFTMPESEYATLADLKKKCLRLGVHVKKSELLRAGLNGLALLPEPALLAAVAQVEKLKTGRPNKE